MNMNDPEADPTMRELAGLVREPASGHACCGSRRASLGGYKNGKPGWAASSETGSAEDGSRREGRERASDGRVLLTGGDFLMGTNTPAFPGNGPQRDAAGRRRYSGARPCRGRLSLLPLVRREPVVWRDGVFFEIRESGFGCDLRTRHWKHGVVSADADAWTDPGSSRNAESYLYDLQHGPHELAHLAGHASHSEVVCHRRERLLARMREPAGELDARIEPAPARPRYEQPQVLDDEINA